MSKFIRRNLSWRITIALAALIVPLFFIGAGFGSVASKRSSRSEIRKSEREQWQGLLMDMSENLPEKYRKSWRKIAAENPERLLKITALHQKY